MAFQNNFKEFLSGKSQTESDNLTEKEMQDLEEAIQNSKKSASHEEMRREHVRQSVELQKLKRRSSTGGASSSDSPEVHKEKPFSPKQWSKQPKSPADVSKITRQLSHKEFYATFEELEAPLGKPLDVIHHPPMFELPVTSNPRYKKYSVGVRAKLLSNYFTNLHAVQAELARKSLLRAPDPKPILPSNKYKNSLYNNDSVEDGINDELLEQLPVQDLYVSRAGRQIKRKIYTEEGDSDNDLIFSNKKNKADDSDTKIILDTPCILEDNPEGKTTPKIRKDTPRTFSQEKNMTRSEKMFEELKKGDEKRKQHLEEMEHFQRTLPNVEADGENWLAEAGLAVIIEDDDSSFIRKRVVPPKRGGRGRRTQKQESNSKSDAKSKSPPSSPVLKRSANFTKNVENKAKLKSKTPKTITEETSAKVDCPICSKQFPKDEIAEHAASCGEEPPIVGSAIETIKCSLCEREFPKNTDYEVHVKQCIAVKAANL